MLFFLEGQSSLTGGRQRGARLRTFSRATGSQAWQQARDWIVGLAHRSIAVGPRLRSMLPAAAPEKCRGRICMDAPLLGGLLTSEGNGGDLQTAAKLNQGCSGAAKGRLGGRRNVQ